MSPRRRPSFSRLLWIAWAALACGLGTARADGRPIRFERLAQERGLSQNTVLCMFQDSRGYIWLGTEDGLNRFDGSRFRVYKADPADPNGLPHDAVWAIEEDAKGDLWIGTDGGGLARWDRASDRFVGYGHDSADPKSLPTDYVRALHVEKTGALWVGTRNAGLSRLDPTTGAFTHFRHDASRPGSLSDDRVYAVAEDRASNLWVGTNLGLDRLDRATGTFVHFAHDPARRTTLSDDRVRAIFEDRAGALWIGTNGGGLNRLDVATGTVSRFRHDPDDPTSLAHDEVRAILEDDSGRLWVGTGAGLSLLDERGSFVRYGHDPASPTSLGDAQVMSLLQDRGGVLWVGTRSGGANKWNPLTWQFGHHKARPDAPDALSNANVTSFAEDRAGRLWVGTFGGGLNVMSRMTGEVVNHRHDPTDRHSLSSDRITALRHDHGGALWVGTLDAGLNRLDPRTGTFSRFRNDPQRPGSLAANGIMCLFEDSRGVLWVGTFGGGLDRYDPRTGTFSHFRHDPDDPRSISSDRVTSIGEAPTGHLWVGTDGGGLNRFDPRGQTFEWFQNDPKKPESLSAQTVFALHVDQAGVLWIGTRGGGLDKLETTPGAPDQAVFQHHGERDGLPNDVIYAILPDSIGNLWLSTNRGLSRFSPRIGKFTSFGASHGLQADEFHFGSAFRSTSGELFFGGVNGFNAFFPERLKRNGHVPPVVLTGFLKLNAPAPDTGPADQIRKIELGHRDDVVTFEFAALDFSSPESNSYAYMLEGFDRDWIDLGSLHRVTYTDLDAGSYVFRVRAANNDSVWNEDGLAIAVEVAPAPWQTGWAYTAYTLTLIGLCFGFVQLQQRRLRREEGYSRRLEQQVRERTEEVARRAEELEGLNKQLVRASLTDSLTGLANRRFLFEYVEKEVKLVHRRYHQLEAQSLTKETFDLAFLMVDLDDFKAVNDTCGHAAGDIVLMQVRQILEGACRQSDILIRWGGDEFLIVARESDPKELDTLAERVRSQVANHVFELPDGRVLRTTCSIGFASYPFVRSQVDAIPWERVVDVADYAMYVAKRSGRNAWIGLASTERTSLKGLLATLRGEPERLVETGMLEIRSSVPDPCRLVWR